MSRLLPVLAAATFAIAMLAGCASNSPQEEDAPRLSRRVTVSLDAESVDESADAQQALQDAADLAFEYTHQGEAIAAADVTVHYKGPEGEAREAPLSDFTEADRIEPGNVVRIEPGAAGTAEADLLTPMQVKQGDAVLAERGGASRDWLRVNGAPVPVAFSQEGKAQWALSASSHVALRVEGFQVTETECRHPSYAEPQPGETEAQNRSEAPPQDFPEEPARGYYDTPCQAERVTNRLDSLNVNYDETITGTFHATATLPAAGPRLAYGADLVARFNASFEADVTEGDERMEGTGTGWLRAELREAETALQFDAQRELRNVTTRHTTWVDGDVDLTGDFADEAPDMERPIHEETYGPETEEVPQEETPPPELVSLLARAWVLDLEVGDQLSFDLDMPGPDSHSRFVSQVLARETRSVGGEERDVFKLSDSLLIEIDPLDGGLQSFAYDYTYWVDAATYLPVAVQGHVERTFNHAELNVYLESAREFSEDNVEMKLPDAASLTVRLDSSLQLQDVRGDLSTSAVLGAAGVRLVPMSAAFFMMGTNPFTAGSDEGYEEHPALPVPSIGWSWDSETRTGTVVHVGEPVLWEELAVDGCLQVPAEAPVRAGDRISECEDEVMVWHVPTNSILVWHSFAGDGA